MTRALTLLALAVTAVPLAGQPAKKPYTAPRTPWGDPDLQGVWPATDMVGTPLQRASEFGTRNVLTEEEFRARQLAAARQNDEDNADFSIDKVTPEQEARGTVGGPASGTAVTARARSAADHSFVMTPSCYFLPSISANASRATRNASTPAGTPQ